MDKRRKQLRTKLFLAVAGGMTGLLLLAFAFHFGFFEGLQRQWVDTNFSIRGKRAAPKDLVDLPDNVREEMTFVFAERIEEVLTAAIPGLLLPAGVH